MKQVLLMLCLLFTIHLISRSSSSPTNHHLRFHRVQVPDKNICKLPRANGGSGLYGHLEDCPNITNFKFLPMPAPKKDLGVHPYVCCPRYDVSHVCFPTNPWCPSSRGTEQQSPIEDEEYYDPLSAPKVSENVCPNRMDGDTSATCINFKDCEGILNEDVGSVDVCGWDESDKALMVCCPLGALQGRKHYKPYPRYSQKPETPYLCDNKADYVSKGMCQKWQNNGGCVIDKHFELTKDNPEDTVTSHEMFHFMMMSCMETCSRCNDSVCQDEHSKCPIWARSNMCVINPWFMGHTCRESCGVCGFLSPFDKTEQRIAGKTYSNVKDHQFDCGRKKLLKEALAEQNYLAVEEKKMLHRTTESNNDVFFAAESEANEYSCEETIIADRWAIAAAHCYPSLRVGKVIRNYKDPLHMEQIEIKKVYKHPSYKWPRPNVYSDIAVVELGRRIAYDFEKYGDTPACLNHETNIIGGLASLHGYGDRGRLMESDGLRIISHDECRDIFRYNITGKSGDKRKLKVALPVGLNDQLICAQGIYNEELGEFTGSCKGDSGGPLFLYPDEKQTLVGIVSGGIGCGKGIPGWYTKVSFFTSWITCIMESSMPLNNDHAAIQKYCLGYTQDGSIDSTNWLD